MRGFLTSSGHLPRIGANFPVREEEMRESIVQEVAIVDGGKIHKASYFVEYGTLHANVGGRIIRLGIGADQSEETVRRLLLGHIQTRAWKRRMVERWTK